MVVETRTRLAEILDHQGRRQQWLAEQSGISEVHISRLVNGRSQMRHRTAARLAAVLGVPAAWLMQERSADDLTEKAS